jgi:hypothetical protein
MIFFRKVLRLRNKIDFLLLALRSTRTCKDYKKMLPLAQKLEAIQFLMHTLIDTVW